MPGIDPERLLADLRTLRNIGAQGRGGGGTSRARQVAAHAERRVPRRGHRLGVHPVGDAVRWSPPGFALL